MRLKDFWVKYVTSIQNPNDIHDGLFYLFYRYKRNCLVIVLFTFLSLTPYSFRIALNSNYLRFNTKTK